MARTVKADLTKDPMGRIGDAIRVLKGRSRVVHTGGELYLGINHVKKNVIGGNPKKRSKQQRKLLREYKHEAYASLEAHQHRVSRQSKV